MKYYGISHVAQILISIYWVISTSPQLIATHFFSSIASECHFIDFLAHHGLSQNVSVSHGKQLFSEHYPIFFNLDFVNFRPQSHGSPISESSFNNQIFNTNLHGLFELMSTENSLNPHYPDQWYSCFIGCFNSAVKFKRSKRMNLPLFYSSRTVNLINHKETILRRLSSQRPFLQPIKLKKLLEEL